MARRSRRQHDSPGTAELRIIGGKFRGRKLAYEMVVQGRSLVTRPMKHRTREAIFNLISVASQGRHAIDLFAGTGALGLEALSRGAIGCTFIEKHVPTARIVKQNIATLGVEEQSTLLITSAFLWAQRELPLSRGEVQQPHVGVASGPSPGTAEQLPPGNVPWLMFCSPPYDFYVDRRAEMAALIRNLTENCPLESLLVVEADERLDTSILPGKIAEGRKDSGWDVRRYSPAVVCVWQKLAGDA